MRLTLPASTLEATIRRALIGNPTDPSPEDLIELYLFLPVTLEIAPGQRFVFRSSLEALLTDAHRVTGRDDNGDVVDEGLLGTWLGAMGYLSLIDQAGKAVRWSTRPAVADSPFEAILVQHGVPASEAAALYGLRNAMVHSYGLANENHNRPECQHFFRLEVWGGAPRVVFPDTPWNGDPADVNGHETTVSLQAVGNLGEVLVLDLAESWLRDRDLQLANGLSPELMRRRYFFAHGDGLGQA